MGKYDALIKELEPVADIFKQTFGFYDEMRNTKNRICRIINSTDYKGFGSIDASDDYTYDEKQTVYKLDRALDDANMAKLRIDEKFERAADIYYKHAHISDMESSPIGGSKFDECFGLVYGIDHSDVFDFMCANYDKVPEFASKYWPKSAIDSLKSKSFISERSKSVLEYTDAELARKIISWVDRVDSYGLINLSDEEKSIDYVMNSLKNDKESVEKTLLEYAEHIINDTDFDKVLVKNVEEGKEPDFPAEVNALNTSSFGKSTVKELDSIIDRLHSKPLLYADCERISEKFVDFMKLVSEDDFELKAKEFNINQNYHNPESTYSRMKSTFAKILNDSTKSYIDKKPSFEEYSDGFNGIYGGNITSPSDYIHGMYAYVVKYEDSLDDNVKSKAVDLISDMESSLYKDLQYSDIGEVYKHQGSLSVGGSVLFNYDDVCSASIFERDIDKLNKYRELPWFDSDIESEEIAFNH